MSLLKGKFAVVTGAASARGLGKATAKLFAEHEATGRIDVAKDAVVPVADLPRQPGPEKIAPVFSLAGGDIGYIDDLDQNKGVRNRRFLPHDFFHMVLKRPRVGQTSQRIRSCCLLSFPCLFPGPRFAAQEDEQAHDHRQTNGGGAYCPAPECAYEQCVID